MMRKATIADIATKARVSTATVDRVLHGRLRVRAALSGMTDDHIKASHNNGKLTLSSRGRRSVNCAPAEMWPKLPEIVGEIVTPPPEIARRARGTPRIANRLLRRVRDYAEVRGDGTISEATAKKGLKLFGVDELGLDKVDRAILNAICVQFNGGPVGLSTVAISVGEQPETVEDMYEPFLIQQGMIARTPRGRIAMAAAYEHLGIAAPTAERSPGLFD